MFASKHISIPPNSFKIISGSATTLGTLELIDFFTGWITPAKTFLFYTVIIIFSILFLANLFFQYSKITAEFQENSDNQKKKIKELQKTSNNLQQLYDSINAENLRYADEQNKLKEASQNKDKTFAYFVYQLIDIDTPDPRIIELLYQMSVSPNNNKELTTAGKYALEQKLQARKDIDAIVATEENKDGQS